MNMPTRVPDTLSFTMDDLLADTSTLTIVEGHVKEATNAIRREDSISFR
jgi:hypothetical protein